MPSASISTPELTPSVDRLSLGVSTAREAASSSMNFLGNCTRSASSED